MIFCHGTQTTAIEEQRKISCPMKLMGFRSHHYRCKHIDQEKYSHANHTNHKSVCPIKYLGFRSTRSSVRAIKGLCGNTNVIPKLVVVYMIVHSIRKFIKSTMSVRQLCKETGKRPSKVLFYFPQENKTGIAPTRNIVDKDAVLSEGMLTTVNWAGEKVQAEILALSGKFTLYFRSIKRFGSGCFGTSLMR